MLMSIIGNWRIDKKEWKIQKKGEVIEIQIEKEGVKWLIVPVYVGKEKSKNLGIIERWMEEEKGYKIIIDRFQCDDRGRSRMELWRGERKSKVERRRGEENDFTSIRGWENSVIDYITK